MERRGWLIFWLVFTTMMFVWYIVSEYGAGELWFQ